MRAKITDWDLILMARIPAQIGDAGLPNLISAMRAHGYGEALISKLASENWLKF
jgi:membrane dipeptidase